MWGGREEGEMEEKNVCVSGKRERRGIKRECVRGGGDGKEDLVRKGQKSAQKMKPNHYSTPGEFLRRCCRQRRRM